MRSLVPSEASKHIDVESIGFTQVFMYLEMPNMIVGHHCVFVFE